MKFRFHRSALLLALAGVALPASLLAAQPSSDRYIVKYKSDAAAGVARAAIASAGRVVLDLSRQDAVAAHLSASAVAALRRNPNVEYVEHDVPRYALALATPSTGNPYAAGQLVPYGIKLVQADQLPDTAASSRKVCIIDSGYERAHEDLSQNVVDGTNDVGTGLWSTDENGHGTHVAGTVAAVNNSLGVVGVAPNKQLKLHIVKVFGADGWAYSSTLTHAVNTCAGVGANVISMSLGGSQQSRTEKTAFDKHYAAGILSIAAAGNDGNTRVSYPAGYASVMSVAALDENKAWASFSQYNKSVEIAAPGVSVLSTVPMGTGRDASLSVGSTSYAAAAMDGSPLGNTSGALLDCGAGTAACAGAQGKVCLIQRGTNTFAEKVLNCQAGGGVAAVIYNNVAGMLYGTMGETVTAIPSLGVSDTDGAALKAQAGATASAGVTASHYAYFDGTSMATPHVSAVAALVWSHHPNCTAANIRNALNATAMDLGAKGRDTKFGYGLVQALAAKNYIGTYGCTGR
ncbi:MAG TPA: S8 family serine peptidase [Albitalea sp.]